MLERVEPQPVHARGAQIPASPLGELLVYALVGDVHIHAHQIVIIPILRVRFRGPALAGETVDPVAAPGVLVPVRPGKIPVVPGKAAVCAAPAGKAEFGPDAHRMRAVDLCQAVFRAVSHRPDFFQLIPAHAVVEHDIPENADPRLMESADRREVFIFGPVLGADRSLLVKFAQVIHIINAVAHILLRGSLVGRRQPYFRDSEFGKPFRLGGAALPPQSVIGQIPFKVLHHRFVFSNRAIPPFTGNIIRPCPFRFGCVRLYRMRSAGLSRADPP